MFGTVTITIFKTENRNAIILNFFILLWMKRTEISFSYIYNGGYCHNCVNVNEFRKTYYYIKNNNFSFVLLSLDSERQFIGTRHSHAGFFLHLVYSKLNFLDSITCLWPVGDAFTLYSYKRYGKPRLRRCPNAVKIPTEGIAP